jgi:hypothetical protein
MAKCLLVIIAFAYCADACRTYIGHVGDSIELACPKNGDEVTWSHRRTENSDIKWIYNETTQDSNHYFVNHDTTYNITIKEMQISNRGLYICDADYSDCDNNNNLIVLNATTMPFVETLASCPRNSIMYFYKKINSKRIYVASRSGNSGIYECVENNGLGPNSVLHVVHRNISVFQEPVTIKIFQPNSSLNCTDLRRFKIDNFHECRVSGSTISKTGLYKCDNQYIMAMFKKDTTPKTKIDYRSI